MAVYSFTRFTDRIEPTFSTPLSWRYVSQISKGPVPGVNRFKLQPPAIIIGTPVVNPSQITNMSFLWGVGSMRVF